MLRAVTVTGSNNQNDLFNLRQTAGTCQQKASVFGTFFAQSRAQLGAAIARGMALRAFGTSSMGLSKVFLRHIAPERAREDQNLTTDPHFSAGHAQWRYALATRGVCI
jgi:hypothetical protein